jgi:hypothetical protein
MDDKPHRVEQISDTVAKIENSISVINKKTCCPTNGVCQRDYQKAARARTARLIV